MSRRLMAAHRIARRGIYLRRRSTRPMKARQQAGVRISVSIGSLCIRVRGFSLSSTCELVSPKTYGKPFGFTLRSLRAGWSLPIAESIESYEQFGFCGEGGRDAITRMGYKGGQGHRGFGFCL